MQRISPLIGADGVWQLSLDSFDVNPQSIQEWTLLAEMNMTINIAGNSDLICNQFMKALYACGKL